MAQWQVRTTFAEPQTVPGYPPLVMERSGRWRVKFPVRLWRRGIHWPGSGGRRSGEAAKRDRAGSPTTDDQMVSIQSNCVINARQCDFRQACGNGAIFQWKSGQSVENGHEFRKEEAIAIGWFCDHICLSATTKGYKTRRRLLL